jgi:hypothetical protein
MPFYSGKQGFLQVSGVSYPMEEWSLDIEIEEVEVTNFQSGGFKSLINGIAGGTFSATGPYNGIAPFVPTKAGALLQNGANTGNGVTGTFTFGIASGLSFTHYVIITASSVKQNVKEKATLEISGSLTGNAVAV